MRRGTHGDRGDRETFRTKQDVRSVPCVGMHTARMHALLPRQAARAFTALLAALAPVASLAAMQSAAAPAAEIAQAEPAAPRRATTSVFVAGEGGYPFYRIPAATRLATGPRAGRILAFAEGRGTLADNGVNDIVLRTSDDGGASWSPVRTLCDIAGRSLNNPCVVEVREGPRAGRVLVMFQSYAEGCGEACVTESFDARPDAADGMDTICRTILVHSDDGGDTWSAPREVTREVKRPVRATSLASGPGIGIQLARGAHKGRVVMPFNEGPYDRWRVYAAYSDDGGDSWRIGEPAPDDARGVANEVQMFERADGAVVLNARQFGGAKRRKTAVSTDGGATFSTLADVADLPDPSCMAGLLALDDGTVVFTGCDSESRRALGTAWISRDGGDSWPEKVLVEPQGFAYSVPVDLGRGADGRREVGVLYEGAGYRRIEFVRVTLPGAPPAEAAPVR